MGKHKPFMILGFIFSCLVTSIIYSAVVIAASPSLVISRFQAGGSGSGTSQQEFIEIYNNSDADIDITGAKLYYNESSLVAEFLPSAQNIKLYLPAHTSMLVASSQYLVANPQVDSDFGFNSSFTTNIPATNGSIKIVGAENSELDRLGWGSGAGEGVAMTGSIAGGKMFQRKTDVNPDTLVDTQNNFTDFSIIDSVNQFLTGNIYEVEQVIDMCPNIDDYQGTIPPGYQLDGNSDCLFDVCSNIDGLQTSLPTGYESTGQGECRLIPLEDSVISITELLPNAFSYDTGNEFIELYNPNTYTVSLDGYALQVGPSFSKNYPIPQGVVLEPDNYVIFSDTQTGIVLSNTSGSLRLIAPAGNVVSQTDTYDAPPEVMSWALLGGIWQYTNQLTPAAANRASIEDEDDEETVVTSSFTVCPAGKYRNPETNRCRNIESADDALKPCAADQVRNPETNRCRSVFATDTSSLTPCKAGQERNPDTNRCRAIASAASTSLKPCAPGQERNPETNRCRKKTDTASFQNSAEDIKAEQTASPHGWMLAGGAALGFTSYAAWEWRSEVANGFRRLRGLLGKNPPTD